MALYYYVCTYHDKIFNMPQFDAGCMLLTQNDLYSKLIHESINKETISCEFEESQLTHFA